MRKTIFKKFSVLLTVLILLVTPFSVTAAKSKIKNPIYKGTVTVDGTIDEVWNAVDEIKLTFYVAGDESTNASGYGKLLWDEKFVYVLGVVTDSTPTLAYRNGEREWDHDSFEIFLDETNEKIDKNSMTQFRISSLGRVSGQYLDTVVTEAQLKEHYPELKTACAKTATGYVVEFAIPWTRQTNVKADSSKLGFCMQINDDADNSGEAEGIVTTPVPVRFYPAQYPTYTIVSEKAAIEKEPVASEPSDNGGKTSSVTDSSSKDEVTSNTDNNSSVTNGDTVIENNNNSNQTNVDIQNNDTTITNLQMDMNRFMLIVLGAVIVLCLIGIILVYIFVLRAAPKK